MTLHDSRTFVFFTPKKSQPGDLSQVWAAYREAFQVCGQIRVEPQGPWDLRWVSVPRTVRVERGQGLLRLRWEAAGLGFGEGWEEEAQTAASLRFAFITEYPVETISLL